VVEVQDDFKKGKLGWLEKLRLFLRLLKNPKITFLGFANN
jgi:hypothetical protein